MNYVLVRTSKGFHFCTIRKDTESRFKSGTDKCFGYVHGISTSRRIKRWGIVPKEWLPTAPRCIPVESNEFPPEIVAKYLPVDKKKS